MIKIKGNISIPKIEELYSELYSSQLNFIDIQLPKKIEKLDFGLLFTFLQFLATWIRNEKSGKLVLPVDGSEAAIQYLFDNEFVYPSIVLSWEKEIVDENGIGIKSELKNPSRAYFDKMDFFELKGNSVPIYCFDHDKSNRGLSKHLYRNNRELVTEDALGFNLFRAFQKIGSHNHSVFRSSLKKHMDSFNAIIHESFTNTHEHAKTNELGYNLYPNLRGILLKFHKRSIDKLADQYKEYPGLVNYFKSGFQVNEQGELYLVEISILDSGPGLVKRYTGNSEYQDNIQGEVEIIKQCLYRHNTSSIGLKSEIKGIGLDRILQTLDGKGFLRIKTGRTDLFRDMKTNRYSHTDQASEIVLNDWRTGKDSEYTTFEHTEGTLLSIFYPLDYNSK